ncbi:hypothetical protein [Halapricum desulfuricans]|uniref:Uncharacterized protein n=1 Tax=Halapricum desulfuricans TaxID=2841257 RepID=A0A897MX66_9EURY|nr:hypothetical protein [Halapricum desulfuricans]QSG05054.1 hypothetical protein HSR121_0700 [Halapricum desulfuricans]QSG12951.1 hypothetical protein HSBGL_2547 [Halapricum desulfuricans]
MARRDAVLDVVCSQRDRIPVLIAAVIVMGLLLTFPLLLLESDSPGYVIAVIDAIIVAVSLVVFGSTYWYCTKRAMQDA